MIVKRSNKEEIIYQQKIIDKCRYLTLFQRAIIKDIIFFNLSKGEYILIEKYVIEKYKKIITEESFYKELQKLEDEFLIIRDEREDFYNGKLRTTITYKINIEDFNALIAVDFDEPEILNTYTLLNYDISRWITERLN